MGSSFTRALIHAWLTALWILSLGLVADAAEPTTGTQQTPAASQSTHEFAWVELGPIVQRPQVRVWSVGKRESVIYVITHGMGGTAAGDRFHQLAEALHRRFPDACVLRIDWSELASAKIGGFPNPWTVAASINGVGDLVAQILKSEAIDPARTTFMAKALATG
jgi:hypothetical protein